MPKPKTTTESAKTRKTTPKARCVMAWIKAAEETLLYLSVLTLGEIRKGLAALSQGKRRSRLETWLEVELQARFR